MTSRTTKSTRMTGHRAIHRPLGVNFEQDETTVLQASFAVWIKAMFYITCALRHLRAVLYGSQYVQATAISEVAHLIFRSRGSFLGPSASF